MGKNPDLDKGGVPTREGIYEASFEDEKGLVKLDVYAHPELGLCLWIPDERQSIEFDNGGHVPISRTRINFISRLGDLDEQSHDL